MLPAKKALLHVGLLLGLLSLLPTITAQAQAPTPTPADLGALRSEMEDTLSETRTQASTILSLMEVFLGFLAVVLTVAGVIGFIGFREQRQIRDEVRQEMGESTKKVADTLKAAETARSNVEEAYKTAKERLDEAINVEEAYRTAKERLEEAVAMAEEHVQRIGDWRSGLTSAGLDIDAAFQQLPFLESEEVDGLDRPPLPLEIAAKFEDADIILMLSDELKIPGEREKNGVYFLRLAQYWRIVRNYPRALSRAERAVALAPTNPDTHRALSRTLAHWADKLPVDSPLRQEALQRALDEMDIVVSLQGKETVRSLHQRAWILDSEGKLAQAAAILRDGIELDQKEAAEENRQEHWYLTYNLGCALSKAGQAEEAFAEVTRFLEKWPERWPAVKKDPDFESLRSTSPWREKVAALIENAKTRTQAAS